MNCLIRRQASSFTDNPSDSQSNAEDADEGIIGISPFEKHGRDEAAYAREVNERNLLRWRQNQEPKGKVQFMSFGQEFTVPYNLTTIAQIGLNHQRELRAYYRKIMYEMPQFKSKYSIVGLGADLGRICKTISTTFTI
jgi:hypothetical protein